MDPRDLPHEYKEHCSCRVCIGTRLNMKGSEIKRLLKIVADLQKENASLRASVIDLNNRLATRYYLGSKQ